MPRLYEVRLTDIFTGNYDSWVLESLDARMLALIGQRLTSGREDLSITELTVIPVPEDACPLAVAPARA